MQSNCRKRNRFPANPRTFLGADPGTSSQHPADLISVRSLLSGRRHGKFKIGDIVFSASTFRACCFRASQGSLLRSRTVYLDARLARLKGDSFLVPNAPARPPQDSFESKSPGWVLDRGERRMGDIMDILVDSEFRVREFVAGLRHNLLLCDDEAALLSKEARKEFMRRVPDVSSSYGVDAYTIVSVPSKSVARIKTDPLFYEVVTKVGLDDLTNSILRALRAGRLERGLVRELFAELAQ